MLTQYHCKYIAYDLTRKTGGEIDRLSMSLFDASVDLNPHQIEAALFAIQSPLSKGTILADEVGLGKTIEAGIVICQYWAEKKRSIMIIAPASIRKQWQIELSEKFHLPVVVLDSQSYHAALKAGQNPLQQKAVIVMSYNFVSRMKSDIGTIAWDLVVIDEAHKLRNAYRDSNVTGQGIKQATGDARKLLLTATPLQNSLLELYGLTTLIDENMFGDVNSFRYLYMGGMAGLQALRNRITPFCKRTLRNQVTEYVQYTKRRPITIPFAPTDDEQQLYESVTTFLQRPDSYAIPKRQRHLTQMILRKLLASSSEAIAATFEYMIDRLEKKFAGQETNANDIALQLLTDEEMSDELLDEEMESTEEGDVSSSEESSAPPDYIRLREEINELKTLVQLASKIKVDSKSNALLQALSMGFDKMTETGAKRKAVIFTESRRTQEYLYHFLSARGYEKEIVCFNGTNTGPEATAIYDAWHKKNQDTGRISGSRNIDIRTAILEYFQDTASILIATEAAAEGVNLQFCSLVINYDLPWNPQRIEQRIGRCHRYGQKHDVVVINFLNSKNEADCRVLELLTEKFKLFDGVFGASDDVLGTVESGIDFEKRILDIYQRCRSVEEINAAFLELRRQMDENIRTRDEQVRQILFDHFDEDVHQRLRMSAETARGSLGRFGERFWKLTRYELNDWARFDDHAQSFQLLHSPIPEAQVGHYVLISKQSPLNDSQQNSKTENHSPTEPVGDAFLYRLSHLLREYVLSTAQEALTPYAEVVFHLTEHPTKISILEPLLGKSGYLTLSRFVVNSFEDESYLLFNGGDEKGNPIDQETCEKLFNLDGDVRDACAIPDSVVEHLNADVEQHINAARTKSLEMNNQYFHEAEERLYQWAEDQINSLEQGIKKLKSQKRDMERQLRHGENMSEKLEVEKSLAFITRSIRSQCRELDSREDEIDQRRDNLIHQLEKCLHRGEQIETLFTIRWSVD